MHETPRKSARTALLGLAAALVLPLLYTTCAPAAESLPDLIDRIRPSIVGVGTFQKTRRPPSLLRGTGFVVGNGRQVITNAHVLPESVDTEKLETLAVFVGRGDDAMAQPARVLSTDTTHDVALLAFEGPTLPALELGDSDRVREGTAIAFTGFPIGAILGLYPVTHTGTISAVTPIVIPQISAQTLTAKQIRLMREPWNVFQLDATAYPGNSGSPVYDVENGKVIGVINMVLVKQTRENVLKDPSAISYAIPIRFARALLDAAPAR